MQTIKLLEILIKFKKSKIKARDGKEIGKYPLYTCSPILNKYLDEYIYDDEAIILGTGGNPVINYYKGKFATSTDCFTVKSNDKFYTKYIYYFLTANVNKIESMFRGAGLKHLNKNELLDMEVNFINKNVQAEIIKKLDMINCLFELKNKQLEELDTIIKSQFVEMFGDPIQNSLKWNTDTINNVAPTQNYKGTFENKVWLLGLDMVESNSGRIINYLYEDVKNIGSSTCTFNEENILYSKLRPYLNKVVIPNKKGYATSELVPLKPNKDKLNRYFLAYLLRSEQFVQYISEKVVGAKMPRVSMDMFRNFNLILPPIELQNKFANIVQQIDKQKFEIENSLKEMQKLYENLMEKYFG